MTPQLPLLDKDDMTAIASEFGIGKPLAGSAVFKGWGNKRYGVSMRYDYWPEARWRAVFADLGLETVEWRPKLSLYPALVDWLFGGALHLLADLRVPGAREPE